MCVYIYIHFFFFFLMFWPPIKAPQKLWTLTLYFCFEIRPCGRGLTVEYGMDHDQIIYMGIMRWPTIPHVMRTLRNNLQGNEPSFKNM